MTETATRNRPSLYERDFHEWTRQQARAIAERRVADVDWANVAEEMESVGASERRALRSYLVVLFKHLAKWEFQPERRTASWQTSISNARTHIEGIVDTSPSLKNHPEEILDKVWKAARAEGVLEMRCAPSLLPLECPYTVDRAMDRSFMPGPDWNDDDIIDE